MGKKFNFVKSLFRNVEPGKANSVVQMVTKKQLKTPVIIGGLATIGAISAGLSLKDYSVRNRMGKVYSDAQNNLSNLAIQTTSPAVTNFQNGKAKMAIDPARKIFSTNNSIVDGSIVMALHDLR